MLWWKVSCTPHLFAVMIKQGKTIVPNFDPQRFPIAVVAIPNHPEYPLHTHAFTEIQIVLKGSATNVVDGCPYRVGPGSVFILYGSHNHAIKDVDQLHLLNVLFDPTQIQLPGFITRKHEALASLLVQQPLKKRKEADVAPFLMLNQDCLARVEALGYQLLSEIQSQKLGCELFSVAYLLEIMALLTRSCIFTPEVHPKHVDAIEKACNHMSQHYMEQMDMDKVARQVGLSRSRFYNLFHQIQGQSPGSYLLQLRNRRAAYLLKNSQSSITEIAYEVGFSDSNYFSRSFSRMFGASPRVFRKAPICLVDLERPC